MSLPRTRDLLLPFVPLYAIGSSVKNVLFDRGALTQHALKRPVISVGSLSAGGAGKTPLVFLLASLMQERGFDVRILTRGYGRTSTEIERVSPSGPAERSGDEPLMLARALDPIPVYAGPDRYQAGLFAEREQVSTDETVYLLDDGFQHRKLVRNIDIVLLTQQDIEDRLLPAGDLREPLTAMRRADILVVRQEEARTAEWLATQEWTQELKIWVISRKLRFAPGTAPASRPVVFSGLARPKSFISMLSGLGIQPVAVSTFRDHHPYSLGDMHKLLKLARASRANGFLTTEKDAVKLDGTMLKALQEAGEVIVPSLHVELLDQQESIDEMLPALRI